MSALRDLPSIDKLLQLDLAGELIRQYGREMTLQALRQALEQFRGGYTAGQPVPSGGELLVQAAELLRAWLQPTLRPVINATGVILHTNLGRAPLSREATEAVTQAARGYNTLEFSLSSGKRGSRILHAEDLLTRLTGAEAAMAVNNNAGAVLLALSALAKRKRVIIARSQLVEIGGGFRVPDVMKQSGAYLVEIGATNRVHLADYEAALNEPAALLLHAHTSNFRMIGFTSEPSLAEIAQVAHRHSVPLVSDVGSGALLDTSRWGLAKEPMVQEVLSVGADMVCFSGDKLLGGPQAGILAGRKEIIDKLRKHPLARALRADKMSLAALSATLAHYLKGEALEKIPVWRMISVPAEELKQRALRWQSVLGAGEVVESLSTVGGGSLPEETLPGYALRLAVKRPDKFLARLRDAEPPVIARIMDDQVLLDPRTVFLHEEEPLLAAVRLALGD